MASTSDEEDSCEAAVTTSDEEARTPEITLRIGPVMERRMVHAIRRREMAHMVHHEIDRQIPQHGDQIGELSRAADLATAVFEDFRDRIISEGCHIVLAAKVGDELTGLTINQVQPGSSTDPKAIRTVLVNRRDFVT